MRVEELEGLQGPEDVDVDFRRILERSKRRGRKIFETFSLNDMSFLLAEWSRWTSTKERHGDKIRRHLQVIDGDEKTRNS